MVDRITYTKKLQKHIKGIVTSKYKDYYLTGGTALSLYFNHRFSEDLDFFTQNYKKDEPDKIMNYIKKKTGFDFILEAEQKSKKLVPMKVYFLKLEREYVLKIDFVKDYEPNINKIKSGMHSVEDIYYRKVCTAVGQRSSENEIGRLVSTGRQATKDLFDIYYLSKKYKPLSDFFLECFSIDKAENMMAWYKGFNRMDVKLELLDLVTKVDTREVLKYLDDEILKRLPSKLIE